MIISHMKRKNNTSINLNKDVSIRLKEVTKSYCQFLFELLRERDPRANISHKKIPTYKEHVKFVMSKPYSKWYIIVYNNENAGSIYLTKQNEIGVFMKKEFQHKGLGKKALSLLIKNNPRSRYLANVSPLNTKSIQFFKNNGFRLIQYTYEMINSD